MKKLIAMIAVAALGVSANAALIAWGNTEFSRVLDLGGEGLLRADALAANVTIQFINLTQANTVVQTLDGNAFPTKAATAGIFGANWNFTHGVQANTGDTFAILLTATFGGVDYGMSIWANNDTATPWTYTGTDDTFVGTFAWATGNVGLPVNPASPANWNQLGSENAGAWTPVPEPASGMLALAGAAMLLRRRRRA